MFKTTFKKISTLLIFIIFIFSILSASAADSDKGLRLTVLDVGQGLSVLIESDGNTVLYDGGGRESSSYVLSYLKKHGIKSIDCMISSHYDSDHLAGLIGVLHSFTTRNIFCADYTVDTSLYDSFSTAAVNSGAVIFHPVMGDVFSLGDLNITVLSPSNYMHQIENDNSIAVRLDYGLFSCVITGDAEYAAEHEMMSYFSDMDTYLYVVGHHGSSSSSCSEFLDSISPETAFISCGEDNEYFFPAEDTLNKLKSRNIQLFRTDVQGELICETDGYNVYFNCDPTDDWSAGHSSYLNGSQSVTASDNNSPDGSVSPAELTRENCNYVLNTNSHKFHYPWCKSVDKMAIKNTEYSNASRDELIYKGYEPCKTCKP